MENVTAAYLKEVKRALPDAAAEKRKFLRDFKENLDSYVQEKPTAARDDLVERFGSPETIAVSFLPEGAIGEALRAEKRKRLCKRLLVAFFAVCAIILIALFAYRVWDLHNFYSGHYEVKVAEGLPSEDPNAIAVY